MRQDQRSVENILALNQPSEVERDFREFFDSDREDARDIIQSSYESEEEVDVHFYYPRIACTIFVVSVNFIYTVLYNVLNSTRRILIAFTYYLLEDTHIDDVIIGLFWSRCYKKQIDPCMLPCV